MLERTSRAGTRAPYQPYDRGETANDLPDWLLPKAFFHHGQVQIRRPSLAFVLLGGITTLVLVQALGRPTSDQAGAESSSSSSTSTAVPRSASFEPMPDGSDLTEVLTALAHLRGDIRREVDATASIDQITLDRIDDLYDSEMAPIARRTWADDSMQEHPDRLPIPGDESWRPREVVIRTDRCVVVVVESDNSNVVRTPARPKPIDVYRLFRFDGNNRSNPTAWKIAGVATFDRAHLEKYACDIRF